MTRFWILCRHKKRSNFLFNLEIFNEYKFRKEQVNSLGVRYILSYIKKYSQLLLDPTKPI
jgi:hypothetical protein